MLNFLLGYIVGASSSQSSAVVTPMSPEEALIVGCFVFVGLMLALGVFLRGLKRGL